MSLIDLCDELSGVDGQELEEWGHWSHRPMRSLGVLHCGNVQQVVDLGHGVLQV